MQVQKKSLAEKKRDSYWSFLQSYYVIWTGIRNGSFKIVKDKRLNIVINLVKQDRKIENLVSLYYKREPKELMDLISEFKSEAHFLKWLHKEIKLSQFLSNRESRLGSSLSDDDEEIEEEEDDLYSSSVL